MNRFPQALFRMPGAEPIEGRNFETRCVHDADEHEAALADGWQETAPGAAAAFDAAEAESANAEMAKRPGGGTAEGAGAPESRSELTPRQQLEQKATELGVQFSPKLGDAKLAERIEAAEKAQQAEGA